MVATRHRTFSVFFAVIFSSVLISARHLIVLDRARTSRRFSRRCSELCSPICQAAVFWISDSSKICLGSCEEISGSVFFSTCTGIRWMPIGKPERLCWAICSAFAVVCCHNFGWCLRPPSDRCFFFELPTQVYLFQSFLFISLVNPIHRTSCNCFMGARGFNTLWSPTRYGARRFSHDSAHRILVLVARRLTRITVMATRLLSTAHNLLMLLHFRCNSWYTSRTLMLLYSTANMKDNRTIR